MTSCHHCSWAVLKRKFQARFAASWVLQGLNIHLLLSDRTECEAACSCLPVPWSMFEYAVSCTMTRKLVPETRRPILSPCTKPERVAKDAIVTAGPQLSALHCQVINSTPAIVELTPQCLTANYNHFQIQTLHRVHSIEGEINLEKLIIHSTSSQSVLNNLHCIGKW